LSIGDDVYIAYGYCIQGAGGVESNDEIMLGSYSVFSISNHTKNDISCRFGDSRRKFRGEKKVPEAVVVGSFSANTLSGP